MGLSFFTFLVLALGCVCGSPVNVPSETENAKAAAPQALEQEKDDLKADASSYSRRYADIGGGYPGASYGVTGYGTLDSFNSYNGGYGGYGGYDNNYGYNSGGNYPGYNNYGSSVYGYNRGYGGYGNGGYGGYGGYGGNGGNGGLTSYYGYNNPYYQGANHLGYGYYNKKPGYGNIYSNGITPSLVTGYRGYSRR